MAPRVPPHRNLSCFSAYPKQNLSERQVQLISCAGDKGVLIWSLTRPSDDDDVEMMDEHMFEQTKGADACLDTNGVTTKAYAYNWVAIQ